MRARCKNENLEAFPYYGGRSIKICERWDTSFENFYKDVGDRPSKNHSLDRIDNDGDYEPGNVKWSTSKQQSRNRRSNFMITYNGETMTATDWGEKTGIRPSVIIQRITRDKWSVERALTTKVNK